MSRWTINGSMCLRSGGISHRRYLASEGRRGGGAEGRRGGGDEISLIASPGISHRLTLYFCVRTASKSPVGLLIVGQAASRSVCHSDGPTSEAAVGPAIVPPL
jgi:hypothetical protein